MENHCQGLCPCMSCINDRNTRSQNYDNEFELNTQLRARITKLEEEAKETKLSMLEYSECERCGQTSRVTSWKGEHICWRCYAVETEGRVTKLQADLDEAVSAVADYCDREEEIEQLEKELQQAKSEQCPHDYGLLKQIEPKYEAAILKIAELEGERDGLKCCGNCKYYGMADPRYWEHYKFHKCCRGAHYTENPSPKTIYDYNTYDTCGEWHPKGDDDGK